jgi:hypothetical protein
LVAGKHRNDRVDPGLLYQPCDLLLASHPAMLEPGASDPLRNGETIGDDPGESPGL